MFIFAPLARKAKHARLPRVLFYFLSMQIALMLPVAIMLMRTEPAAMHLRLYGGPVISQFSGEPDLGIAITEGPDGFIQELSISEELLYKNEYVFEAAGDSPEADTPAAPETHTYGLRVSEWRESLLIEDTGTDYLFGITPQYAYYVDANSKLAIAVELLPAWVLRDLDFNELFNYLAINANYFGGQLMPVLLLVCVGFFLMQLVYYGVLALLFGLMRKTTTHMTIRERFTVAVYASLPIFPFGFLIGLALPFFHVVIFQLIVIYTTYKTINEYQ